VSSDRHRDDFHSLSSRFRRTRHHSPTNDGRIVGRVGFQLFECLLPNASTRRHEIQVPSDGDRQPRSEVHRVLLRARRPHPRPVRRLGQAHPSKFAALSRVGDVPARPCGSSPPTARHRQASGSERRPWMKVMGWRFLGVTRTRSGGQVGRSPGRRTPEVRTRTWRM